MKQAEPPSSRSYSNTSLFFIGKDSRGSWVVQDQWHRCGGLFVDRTQALRFALNENGHRPHAVVMMPGVFELDLSGTSIPGVQPASQGDARRERAAKAA
jgi:hypothetical protein